MLWYLPQWRKHWKMKRITFVGDSHYYHDLCKKVHSLLLQCSLQWCCCLVLVLFILSSQMSLNAVQLRFASLMKTSLDYYHFITLLVLFLAVWAPKMKFVLIKLPSIGSCGFWMWILSFIWYHADFDGYIVNSRGTWAGCMLGCFNLNNVGFISKSNGMPSLGFRLLIWWHV